MPIGCHGQSVSLTLSGSTNSLHVADIHNGYHGYPQALHQLPCTLVHLAHQPIRTQVCRGPPTVWFSFPHATLSTAEIRTWYRRSPCNQMTWGMQLIGRPRAGSCLQPKLHRKARVTRIKWKISHPLDTRSTWPETREFEPDRASLLAQKRATGISSFLDPRLGQRAIAQEGLGLVGCAPLANWQRFALECCCAPPPKYLLQ